jgi:hypothetical protein
VVQLFLKIAHGDRAYRELVMAERKPIFLHKRSRPQIGYIEGDEVFDLSGNRRCIYNAANGNLSDFDTGKLVGHISLQGFFVGTSWIADELFGQHAPAKHDIPAVAEMPTASLSEERNPPKVREYEADDSEFAAPEDPESLLLDRAIGMIRSVMNKSRS